MKKVSEICRNTFEMALSEYKLFQKEVSNNIYTMVLNNDSERLLTAQLIESDPIDKVIHGSHNRNEIQSIGYFRFSLQRAENNPEFCIFALYNTIINRVDYIIIQRTELIRRLSARKHLKNENQEIYLMFWLMPDGCLYETTNIGAEGEWFYMTKGLGGRMADGTNWDYTAFLNDWGKFTMT